MPAPAAVTRPAASPARQSAASAAVRAVPSTAPASRAKPAPQPLWTRNFVAGTLLNFFIAGNYFMLMVVMTAYALAVYSWSGSGVCRCFWSAASPRWG